ncbi:MAG: tRNA (adenosine(37)-N6)-threonylcarbamoyltransferase complex ATPase subunit type 1 TsaE [Clostridia bacterium]|nr:tRNA (adenosine(37)-N6)-threonylcarbamoyltransferase complex ATPase subunit type 1 TsaE [Clostridia bacterium]
MERSAKNVYRIASPEQMAELGEKLGKRLAGGDVVLLTGELGAGKTVFCKGIARALGIKSAVVSPTFTIMNEYMGNSKFCHFDAYRLEDADEAYGAGLTDFIGNENCVCAVEWWERIPELFEGCNVIHVKIEKTGDFSREVTFS